MTRAFLFDLDGTIIDSEPVAVEAFIESYAHFGGPGAAPVERFLAMAGRPFEEIVAAIGMPDGMVEDFRTRSRARAHRVRVFPGMRQVLTDLAMDSAAVGIITGKDRPRAEHVLSLVGLTPLYGELVTPSDPPRPKPAPDGVHWLCERLGATAANSVLVGDSVIDIAAGQAAGATTVACLWGAGRPADLRAAGPDLVVARPEHLGAALRPFAGWSEDRCVRERVRKEVP
ncbi:HAD family hydrolase [Streptomyces cellostaticus]|uniref:HAD family hydrolase n=1 Tax=Streptomyces cellostaticus TaxID=67285 RepID=UPI002026BCE6|nr:HAD-IA family hydrolase [Streptomyces cellostaticus]